MIKNEYIMFETNPIYDVVIVEKNGKWALKQFSTHKLLTKYIYSYIEDMGNGFFKVQKPNICILYGIIRYDGTEILPCIFTDISFCYNNSFMLVENNSKNGLFDLFGKEILSCEYDIIKIEKDFIRVGRFEHKPFPLKDDIKWGFYNFEGHLLLDMKYDSIVNIKELGVNKFNFSIYEITDLLNRQKSIDGNQEFPSTFLVDQKCTYYLLVDERGKLYKSIDSSYWLKSKWPVFSLVPIPNQYIEPIPLDDGSIVCSKRHSSKHLGLVTLNGKVLLPFRYDNIEMVPRTSHIYQVKHKGLSDILVYNMESGLSEKLYKSDYHKIEYCGDSGKYAIVYMKNKKCGIVSIEDRSLLIPCIYDYVYMENFQIIVLNKYIKDKRVQSKIYSTERREIVIDECMEIKSNPYYYNSSLCKESSWIPFGDKKQVSFAVNINGKWQLMNANFEKVGTQVYEEIEFIQSGVLGYINTDVVDLYDYFGNYKKKLHPRKEARNKNVLIDDYDSGPSWEELGKDEEDYIINNGGDWILDND